MSVRCQIVCLLSAVLLSASVGRAGESRLKQQVYAVSDLVVPAEGAAPATMPEDRLIKLITDTIAPRSWSEKGGRGTIDYYPTTMSLVVNQTPDVQDQIGDLLAALRRLLDTEVSVEVKFVDVAAKVFEDLQRDDILSKQGKKTHARGNVAFLDDAEVLRLMDEVQSDVRSNVMQAPKLTTFSGQTAKINCIDEQGFVTGLEIVHCDDHIEYRPQKETVPLGVRAELRSVISADRRFVRVHLDMKQSNLATPETPEFPIKTPALDNKGGMVTHYIQQPRINKWSVKRALAIPDGHTAVLTGFKGSMYQVEGRNKYGPPILSKIPILGDLFCTTAYGYETHHLLVLVTPRIHVKAEEEEKKSSESACGKVTICPCGDNDFRTPILPPVRDGETVQGEEPSKARILRALPRMVHVPGICEESRDNIQIVTERLVDKIDPPRFFPLVGPAQLHRCHWKCTVYYQDTIALHYPFTLQYARVCSQVVYVDSDHLHIVPEAERKGR
ncbi:MAG TPA: hypothetical protein VH575_07990 [Gemmataceae bacterium]|jgi:hypothetical protein